MERITIKHLDGLVNRLNNLTGMPLKPYDGSPIKPQAGCYHISQAYGGYALHRMSLTDGCSGVSTPLHGGHVPARELYGQLCAFIYGIESVSK